MNKPQKKGFHLSPRPTLVSPVSPIAGLALPAGELQGMELSEPRGTVQLSRMHVLSRWILLETRKLRSLQLRAVLFLKKQLWWLFCCALREQLTLVVCCFSLIFSSVQKRTRNRSRLLMKCFAKLCSVFACTHSLRTTAAQWSACSTRSRMADWRLSGRSQTHHCTIDNRGVHPHKPGFWVKITVCARQTRVKVTHNSGRNWWVLPKHWSAPQRRRP